MARRNYKSRQTYNWPAVVRNAGGTALRMAYKAARNYSQTRYRRRRGGGSASNTTYQHDSRTVYRKKRMPRRLRRRWVRFVKKNIAAAMSSEPTRTYTFNTAIGDNWATDSSGGIGSTLDQKVVYGMLYSYDGSSKANYDVGHILRDSFWGDAGSNSKLLFGSGVLDLTLSYTSDYPIHCELDQYVIYLGDSKLSYSTLSAEIQMIYAAAGAGITLTNRGFTPFQFPALGSGEHRWRVLEKKRFLLSPNQAITYQRRDPRNRMVDFLSIGASDGSGGNYRMRGTVVVLYVAKLIQNANWPTDVSKQIAQISGGVTRNYTVKKLLSTATPSTATYQYNM